MATTILPYLKCFARGAAVTACLAAIIAVPKAWASDHNDGPRVIDPANHAGDITDVYSFREQDQSGSAADKNRVCLVMDCDGLVAPGLTHPFDSGIDYELHIGRGKGSTTTDLLMDFRFGPPGTSGAQEIYMQGKDVGTTATGSQDTFNTVTDATGPIKVYAGPRDDPFFLDLQVIRCGLGCAGGAPTPQDSFGKSNVSAIVASVPLAYLQGTSQATVFSVWGVTRK